MAAVKSDRANRNFARDNSYSFKWTFLSPQNFPEIVGTSDNGTFSWVVTGPGVLLGQLKTGIVGASVTSPALWHLYRQHKPYISYF